jgi:hypothetical protein
VDQFESRHLAFGGIRLIVTSDEFEHTATEHSATLVDLVDGNGQAARNAFPRLG